MKGRIYTVHYGANTSITYEFINEIKSFLNCSLDLVIINNSKEFNITGIDSDYITVFNSPDNLGYFGGFKYGLEKMPCDNLDFIIICNNDVKIINNDFFSELKKKLNNYDIIAPSIINSNNIEQNPHRYQVPSTSRKIYYKFYFKNYLVALLLNKIVKIKKRFNRELSYRAAEEQIFSPHGAFIILNQSFFKKGGYIDDGYFLYGEEDSLSAIASKLKLKTGFIPSLKVYHEESSSIGVNLSRKKYYYQKKAFKYIIKKYPKIFK